MGLMDFAGKVILTYKADTSDAKAKIRELSGEEKKLAQERLAADEKANKGIEKQIKAMGLLAAGIGATIGVVALAKNGLDEYAKTSEHAAKEVARIKTATSTAMDAVQVSIGKTVLAMEPLINGVTSLIKLMGNLGDAGPVAMSALALAITGNPVIAGLTFGATSGGSVYRTMEDLARRKQLGSDPAALGRIANNVTDTVNAAAGGVSPWQHAGALFTRGIEEGLRDGVNRAKVTKGGPRQSKYSDATQAPYTDWSETGGATAGALSQSMAADGVARDMYGNPVDLSAQAANVLFDLYEERTQQWLERTKANAGQNLLDQMFGDNGAINAKMEALDALTSTATAGYNALVDGTMSAGAAMKMAFADAIKTLGAKMLVLSIGETAAGFAAIASGYGFGAAAPHFKAAALYGAGAAAAGLAAASIGTSGGASAGGGASPTAPDSRGSSASSGNGSTDRIIVYDDAFADNNAHERRLRAEKLVRRVTGSGAVRSN